MHKNDYTEDFDLFVKGSLLDAEETPSPRVWQAIESRLPAVTAPAAGGFRWGWYAVAAAAAVAAILAIPGNSDLENISRTERSALAQASSIEIAAIPAPREIKLAARRSFAQADASVAEIPSKGGNEAEAVAAGSEGGNAPQGSTDNGNAGAGSGAGSVSGSGKPAFSGNDRSDQPDPFAAMAAEDAKKAASRRVRSSLWLGGSAGGNESSSGGAAYAAKSTNTVYIENEITENSASNYGIPVSLGAGVKLGVTEQLSCSVGVDYSYLTRSFTGTFSPVGDPQTIGEINHSMRYVGVPVGVYYNLISRGNVKFYLMGVGEAEWCIGNSYNIRSANKVLDEKVSGTQFSAGGGFGVDFALSPHLSLYVDPTVRYYFDAGHPNSIRSEKPLMLNFSAGLRFNL
ncbi:MAG: PorT family protein [Bacteroidales bacterium]|nr:PorT family protein [Bacteroidales bacterium]